MAGQNGVVHAAGLAGELFTAEDRDTLVRDGDLQTATAAVATVGAAHDPRVLAALDTMARRGTIFEPTLDAVRHSVASYDAKLRHIPSLQEEYVRSASRFGMEVTRQAVKRGVRISAGSDHVAYGPAGDRATLFGELQAAGGLASASRPPRRCSPPPATPRGPSAASPGARSAPSRRAATPTWCCWRRTRWRTSAIWSTVELVMVGGKVWRPGQLRSGIAMR